MTLPISLLYSLQLSSVRLCLPLLTRLRLGTDAVVWPPSTALPASSVACWDTRKWEDRHEELVRNDNSGLVPNFSVKVTRVIRKPFFHLLSKIMSKVVTGHYFFIADAIFVPKFLIPDSKSVTDFGPWSHRNDIAWFLKNLLILIPWPVIPAPGAVILDSILLIPDPKYLDMTLN